jgi:serine/threonine protein kinase/Flp pilus assembly protein TadD
MLPYTFDAMDQHSWSRVVELFDRLLDGGDPKTVLSAEPDIEIRTAALNLWDHHKRAADENYLSEPLEFGVAPVFKPGQTLMNRFRIEKMLGSGGMGEVYLAYDQRVDDRVALKTIANLLVHSPSVRKRFVAEVQNARRVTHPNICRIHELFDDGETVFFSMEYLEGVLLSDIPAGSFDPKQARSVTRQMAEALSAAHQIGVIHGDFKPANVIVVPGSPRTTPVQRAVIMDFGLARAIDQAVTPCDQGLSLRAGTAGYMAPELQTGAAPTVRSDIFAFGKVACELMPRYAIWDRCTCVAPEDRPHSLDFVIRSLNDRTSRRYWLSGLALTSMAAANYAFWPTRGQAGLPSEARILVNGFRPINGQLTGARLIRSLLLTSLEQSPRIHAIADQDLLPALRRLYPNGSLPLAGQVLDRVLADLRVAFWIEGDLHNTGERYSLQLRLMAFGQRLVAASAFRDLPSPIALAQTAASWVRTIAGESGQSLTLNSASVGNYTSTVPEALQKYYDASERYDLGDIELAAPLLEEAVRLDTQFAQAHNKLALVENSLRRYEQGFAEIEAAMHLVHKLPERERVAIETDYYRMTEDPVKSLDLANRNLAYHLDEPRFHCVLAQTLLTAGNAQEAIKCYKSALNLAPDDWNTILLLMGAFVEAGQYEQALSEFQVAQSKGVSHPWTFDGAGMAYMGLQRYDEAAQSFEKEPRDAENSSDAQAPRIMQGRFEVAVAAMEEQRARAANSTDAFKANEFLCGLYFVTDRQDNARTHLRQMAELPPYPPIARWLSCSVSWARRLNDARALSVARAAASEIARRWGNAYTQALEMRANALELWREGALADAQTLLIKSSGLAFDIWALFDLAEFFTRNGKWELAAEYWQRFESHQGVIIANGWFPGILVMGWLFRAVAAQALNQREVAFAYSRKVLDHWLGSGSRLQLVQSARNIHILTKPI